MAVEIKVAPDEKLELVRVRVLDTTQNSDYFNVTELPDTFSGGKNAFLIAGSELLEPNTEVKVQIRDSAGEVLYCEFSNGYPDEYYEGISKVVAVYVYPTETAFGPATITLIGQIRDTLDLVKWERKINIDPSLPNTTRVRFYKRPTVSIVEQLAPIYSFDITGSKVASNVTQSFANIKVSQLDTFAGDVKRVKVYRTSEGDISDYDLIQDILVESKELLSTTALSGSVVGEAGLFTSETLKKLWNTGSLNTALTSSRIDNGLSLKGSGYLRYTSSLNLNNGNTYELGIDAFYSASTNSDMGIYISGSQNGAKLIGTLNGITPTKNLKDQVFSFTLDKTEPTASLYLSQSQSEWHVGNISLKLSEDSAFSPSEISFVTSMPTVIGNETYNFKFEFYDVNNNYVPVAVTQSALFTGGNNNIGGTLTLISGSTTELSKSVSYDLWFNPTGSITGSITTVSASVSSVSASLSSSISASRAAAISSSFGNIQTLANGNFSGSFISDTTVYAPVIGGTTGYISQLFKVGTTPSIYLDARQIPRKIFIGGAIPSGQTEYSGAFNNSNTTVYMDSGGKFSLGNKLSWDGSTLNVTGVVNITSGPTYDSIAAAQTTANTATASAAAVDAKVFTDSTGKLARTPSLTASGLFLGSTYLGYYNGSAWKTYMSNTGNFYLSGTGTQGLSWDGSTLNITGVINITSGDTYNAITTAQSTANTANSTANTANSTANTANTNASAASTAAAYALANANTGSIAAVDAKVFTDSNGKLSKTPSTTSAGLFLGSNYMGYYDGANWKTYMANNGNFYLSGAGSNYLSWNGSTLAINGSINTNDANIGGWIINTDSIYKGNISFNSTNQEIKAAGSYPVTIGPRSVYDGLTSADRNSIYLGVNGLQATGQWTDGADAPLTRVRIIAREQFAQLAAVNYKTGENGFQPITAEAYPGGSGQAFKIWNGGMYAINAAASNPLTYEAYDGSGNGGYAGIFDTNLKVYGVGNFTGDVTANTSDKRLKTNIINIDSPLEKLSKINGVYFNWNETAKELANKDTEKREVGLIAQEVQSILPEIIHPAPFDMENVKGGSKSGENYITIQYEKVVPLLVECIKELKAEIEELKRNR